MPDLCPVCKRPKDECFIDRKHFLYVLDQLAEHQKQIEKLRGCNITPKCKNCGCLITDMGGTCSHDDPERFAWLDAHPLPKPESAADSQPQDQGTCTICGHSLNGNVHGWDQCDGVPPSGRCTYCKFCNTQSSDILTPEERELLSAAEAVAGFEHAELNQESLQFMCGMVHRLESLVKTERDEKNKALEKFGNKDWYDDFRAMEDELRKLKSTSRAAKIEEALKKLLTFADKLDEFISWSKWDDVISRDDFRQILYAAKQALAVSADPPTPNPHLARVVEMLEDWYNNRGISNIEFCKKYGLTEPTFDISPYVIVSQAILAEARLAQKFEGGGK